MKRIFKTSFFSLSFQFQLKKVLFAGGGVALVRAISVLDKVEGENIDQTTGVKLVQKALEEPLKQIVNNAGLEGSVVLQKS